ncbi:hypothetical protein K8O68_18785 [Salipaludibacillus sp. CUR1]|uniref:hypothetical protein n=1 Tax=Salipaludibacillus sp. CUR1 TaxID=2820003 RepID=UPI001E584E7F|nr:hypothetical protein [Salipaludibacillus sp. CUR1]
MTPGAFITGLLFIIIHLMTNKILPRSRMKRNKWLSFSAGVAASYVFMYILPALHEEQADFGEEALTMESELYVFGLIGMLIFFAIQNAASYYRRTEEGKKEGTFFWVQLSFFSIYNMLVAYIVISSEVEGVQAAFYSVAIGMHFVAVAHDLWLKDNKRYNRYGRFVLVLGIIAGWLFGMFLQLTPLALSIVFAFISGAMILNVMRFEVPLAKNTHFPSFAFGSVSYSIVVLLLKFLLEW